MAKDRGIEKVEAYFGNFLRIIEERIKEKGKVKILDAGCGYGVAMLGFLKRFGNKVEICGFDYSKNDGTREIMKKQVIIKRIFTKKELEKIKLPKIYYVDANKKLPFKSESFDFIYSLAMLYLIDNKIYFLEECNRILKKQGIARISPAFGPHFKDKKGFPEKYQEMWEIFDKGKEVKIWNYCNKIKDVKAVWKKRGLGHGNKPMYIELKKQKKLNFKLKFISSIDYNFLWKDWGGIKSIYSTQFKFKPRWKKF